MASDSLTPLTAPVSALPGTVSLHYLHLICEEIRSLDWILSEWFREQNFMQLRFIG